LDGDKSLAIKITDNAYGNKPLQSVLKANQNELIIPVNLKNSHNWYDFTVSADGFTNYSQQFAGHVEAGTDSFTDPLMGGVL
jgi:phospholipase C